jgi:cysteinyl-tRNA synthetase, unknown class
MKHLLFSLVLLASCRPFVAGQPACDDDIPPQTLGTPTALLANVNDWTYQLQGKRNNDIDLNDIKATAYDLAVVDYSRDGSETGEFSAAEVASVTNQGQLLLAYISIGEAEDFRFYFNGLPDELLVAQNPAFRDDFKVNFCDQRWKDIIIGPDHALGQSSNSYLDRIIDSNFSGVYLDIIEGYLFFTPGCAQFCEDECEGTNAAEDMARFVQEIAEHARVAHGKTEFLVFPQNEPGIINQLADGGAAYLNAIDAIGQEDTFFFDEKDTLAVDADLDPQCEAVIPALDQFIAAGKKVFTVDYLKEATRIDDFYTRSERRNYIPYAANSRDLDEVVVTPGHEPD